MQSRTLIGVIVAVLWLTALPAWAVEYRLQVANIDDETFASYEGKAPSFWSMKEPMGRLEARLDDNQFSRNAILPGHRVELVEDPAYGGVTPTKVSRLPATRPSAARPTRPGKRATSPTRRSLPSPCSPRLPAIFPISTRGRAMPGPVAVRRVAPS